MVTAMQIINNMLFTTSNDGSLKIWNFTEAGLILTKTLSMDNNNPINAMIFVEEKGNLILGLQNGQMVAFNANYERGNINSFNDAIVGLEQFTSENLLVCVSAHGLYKCYDVAQNYMEKSTNGREGIKLSKCCIAHTENSKYLVLSGKNGTISLQDSTMRFIGVLNNVHNSEIRRLRPFTFQGLSLFISVSLNGTLAIWKVSG